MSSSLRRGLFPYLRTLVCFALLLVVHSASPVESHAAARSAWTYTALGDSLATGFLSVSGYVPRYRDDIKTDTGASVTLINDGQNGWTSDSLVWALSVQGDETGWQRHVHKSYIVTWDIGGNDFRKARDAYRARTVSPTDPQAGLRDAVVAFKSNWDGIIASILALRSGSPTVIRTMDLYNPYVSIDQNTDTWSDVGNDFQVFKQYLDDINAYIHRTTTESGNGILCAPVYAAFNGPNGDRQPTGMLAFDGVHPNDTGHQVIADLLRNLGYTPCTPP